MLLRPLQQVTPALCQSICFGRLHLMANCLGRDSCEMVFLYISSQVALICAQRVVLVVLKRGKRNKRPFVILGAFSITKKLFYVKEFIALSIGCTALDNCISSILLDQ